MIAYIEGTERFIPDFEALIFDLTIYDIDTICSKCIELRAFLKALKYSRDMQVLVRLPEIIRAFNDCGTDENEYLIEILLYIGVVLPTECRNEFLQIIRREHKHGESLMKTVADSFREEGIEIGIQKGEKIGMQKGEKKGRLEDKFEIARRMMQKGMNIELIMELTKITIEQIREIQKTL